MKEYEEDFTSHKRRTLFGMKLQFNMSALFVLEKFLNHKRPNYIIELGTGQGVLSKYFDIYAKYNNSNFMTFDISRPNIEFDFNFILGDVYNDEDMVNMIVEKLNDSETPMLFVDAFDPKSTLLNFYSKKLKSDTFILAHDFATAKSKNPKWCFNRQDVDFSKLEEIEPFTRMSSKYDARTFYGKIK